MKLIFDLDVEQCIGCGACSVACMDQNDFEPGPGRLPYRTAFTLETRGEGGCRCESLSMACMHCADAPCVKACPAGCISKDGETGLTVFNNSNCIGCRSCAMACPFGAPRFDQKGRMVKCDGCIDRLENGLEPACVRICPFDALRVCTEEEYASIRTGKGLHRMSQVILDRG